MVQRFCSVVLSGRRRRILGITLGVVFFLIFSLGYGAYLPGIVSLCLFSLAGHVKLTFCNGKAALAAYSLWTLACIAAGVLFPYYEIYSHRIWEVIAQYTPASTFAISSLILVIGMGFFFFLTGSWRASVISTVGLLSLAVILNGYIFRFRGKEILFSDIFSASTAVNVAGQYDLTMQRHTLLAVMLILWLLFLGFSLPSVTSRGKAGRRLAVLAVDALLTVCFCMATRELRVITWNSDGTLMYGYYLNVYLSVRDYFVEKPEGYSDEAVRALEEQYDQAGDGAAEELPNILVIMNESFADLDIFGSEVKTNQPVTPFLDGLRENVISGHALTSVYGGGTANAEFEVLSSFTMQFFPESSTPYQQYIYEDLHSLTWLLDSLGYSCMATHPYLANGWSRPKVYPLLGFSQSTFLEDYPAQDLLRSYVSDQEMYEYLLGKLDRKNGAPVFLFGITMQNHGGYGNELTEEEKTVRLNGYGREYPQAEEYLSLIHWSDQALEYLITELEKRPEKTVVLFFGDHLPQIEPEFYEELFGSGFDTLDSQMLKYTVPFFIWANYDIPEQTVECTSLNYLARYLLEAAGIQLSPYYRFLKEAEAVIPAVNAMGYYSREAQGFLPVEEAAGQEAQWLSRYEILQYNGMFDKDNQSAVFFGRDMAGRK